MGWAGLGCLARQERDHYRARAILPRRGQNWPRRQSSHREGHGGALGDGDEKLVLIETQMGTITASTGSVGVTVDASR